MDPNDLKPCNSCKSLFGRFRVGFRSIYETEAPLENWLSTDALVCVLCKRDPKQNNRWIRLYERSRPWEKQGKAKPCRNELMFLNMLALEKNPQE